MTNLLFYAPFINRKSGGIFNYSINTLISIRLAFPNKKIIVFGSKELLSEIPESIFFFERLTFKNSAIKRIKRLLNQLLSIVYLIIKIRFKLKDTLDIIIQKNNIAYLYSPYQHFPYTKNKIRGSFTLHDIQELEIPSNFSLKERLIRFYNLRTSIFFSNKILCSYNHVKVSILKKIKLDNCKVIVTGIPLNNHWVTKKIKKQKIKEENYLLYPAATWPHKNHKNLILAFSKLNKKNIKLICTGQKTNHFSELNTLLIKEGIDNVLFLGVIDEEKLYNLYINSIGVVVPSLYEAGSFPLYESIYLEVPAICSNISSLSDIIVSQEQQFDGNDIESIYNKIYQLVFDESFSKSCKENAANLKKRYFGNEFEKRVKEIISG